MMNLENLGDRVRQRREDMSMTQQELADRSGYTTRAAISMIEKGRRDMPMSQLKRVANALNCDPLWLMYGDNKEKAFVTSMATDDARLVAKYRALPPEDRAIIDNLLDSLYAKVQTHTP